MNKLEDNEAYIYLINNGYDIMTPNEVENLDYNEYFSQKKFEANFDINSLDYNLNEITEKKNDDGTTEVSYYVKTQKNLSYLDWFERKDWKAGVDWYERNFSFVPFIEEMSLCLVKADLKGKMKLDKYEINDLKQIVKRNNKYQKSLEVERNKLIRDIKKKNQNKTKFRRGNFVVDFDGKK